MRWLRVLATTALVVGPGVAQTARAQSTTGLAGLLLRFFSPDNPVVLAANPNPALNHAAHFASQPAAHEILTQLNQGIATQLSTFPLGSSSGGFTYTFDETLGVYNRTAQSFGPVITERPLTIGKGKFSLAVNYQHATWDTFENQDLRNGDIHFFLVHQDVNGDGSNLSPWFEGDIIRADLSLELTTDTTVVFANYGLGERLDIGLAVPFQRVDMRANILTTIEKLSTSADPFVVHQFDDGSSEHTYLESGSASGIGDLLVRAKWNFLRKPSAGLALGLDLRLPTGDETNLLGSGATQTKVFLIAGGSPGRFSPRASFGYTFSSGGSNFTGDLPDEIGYTAGFDLAPHSRLTLTADFVGRTLRDTGRLVPTSETFMYVTRLDPTVRETTRTTLGTETGNLNLYLASVGFKLNPAGRLLIVGNVLLSLGDSGLQDKVTPIVGLDYSF
jgi:Putative MetA-pathway of phenol degradation